LEDLHRRYGGRVHFLAVYVREAHPTDGWRMPSNDKLGIAIAQPRTQAERDAVAKKCCAALEMSMPMVVDDLYDTVGNLYSGMPDRLYVIDPAGRVAYKGGRGPFGFKTGEMEQSLVMLLLDQKGQVKVHPERIPAPSEAEAWKKLPPAEKGADAPLPAWARTLAPVLPRTTAAMLELDYLHRARNPLDAKLRGKLRWVTARANGCAYSEAYAAADLRRAGVSAAEVEALAGDLKKLPKEEREALAFARKLARSQATITDEEVDRLIKRLGEKQFAALVLFLAHANFQDRLILALGVPVEPGGPLPPREFRFAKKGGADAPPRRSPADQPGGTVKTVAEVREWADLDFDALQKRMEVQRERKPRVRVPTWEEVKKQLPADLQSARPVRIRWSLVCLGYQPELALAWSACTRAFGQEAKQDRVFEESLFWVVTRTQECFY